MFKDEKKKKNVYEPRSESVRVRNLKETQLCNKLLDNILNE